MSQRKGGWYDDDDKIILDIHAITELRDQNVPLTDGPPKYNYCAKSEDKDAEYGKYLLSNR